MFDVGEVIGVGAFEIFDAAAFEIPDARGDFVDHVVVVRDEQNGAIVFLQRDIQRVDGLEVKVVRGLVEHENIGLLQHQLAENDSRGFAAGKRFRRLQRVVAAEKHLAEQAAQLLLRRHRIELVQPLDHRGAFDDGVRMILREIADERVVPPRDRAAINRELLLGIVNVARRVADQRFQQRGLPRPVAAGERDFFAARYGRGKRMNHFHAVV